MGDKTFNILLLGDSKVGKTSLIMRFSDNVYNPVHITTIGIDFKIKTVTLSNGKQIKLKIWDTAGQERFRTLTNNYFKNAHGIIIAYDCTEKKSYEGIKAWVEQIKNNGKTSIPALILGNKCDLEEDKVVQEKDGKDIAKTYGMDFFETSSKTGYNVQESFLHLVEKVYASFDDENTETKGVAISSNKGKKKNVCC
jgi:small GTP-binding protein